MSQSVKLKDGSYIDAGNVWDNDRQETVEDTLKCSRLYLKSYIIAAGDYSADSSTRVEKQGHVVMLIFTARANDADVMSKSVWCTLPEGYRPVTDIAINAMTLFEKTGVYAHVHADGTITNYTGISAGAWWGFTASYLTD